jgi:hypothetical protein
VAQRNENTSPAPLVTSIVGLVVALFALGFALLQLVRPPFTDEQLRDDLVDTWAAYSFGSLVFVAIFSVCFVVSLVCSRYSRASTRLVLAAASVAFLAAVALELVAANDLKSRAERASGTSLSWF